MFLNTSDDIILSFGSQSPLKNSIVILGETPLIWSSMNSSDKGQESVFLIPFLLNFRSPTPVESNDIIPVHWSLLTLHLTIGMLAKDLVQNKKAKIEISLTFFP